MSKSRIVETFKQAPRTFVIVGACLLVMLVTLAHSIAQDGWSALGWFVLVFATIMGIQFALQWAARKDDEK